MKDRSSRNQPHFSSRPSKQSARSSLLRRRRRAVRMAHSSWRDLHPMLLVALLIFVRYWTISSRTAEAASVFRTPLAFFGRRGEERPNEEKEEAQQSSRSSSGRQLPPPPPPPRGAGYPDLKRPLPPPPQSFHSITSPQRYPDSSAVKEDSREPPKEREESASSDKNATTLEREVASERPPLPPPPPPILFGPPPQGPWMPPPSMQHEAHWMTEQRQDQQPPPYPYGTLGGPEDSSFAWHLQHDLDESLRREQELLAQLRNITASADAMEQRERLHLQTLDVLTERVMEVESEAARQRNELLEYRVNCTQLAEQVGVSEGEVEEWKTKCLEWMERHEEDEEKMDNLRKKLKMSSRRAEDLAAMIERHRLDQKKGESYRKRDEKKRGGFWSWLFGLGSIEDEDVDDYDGMYEAGRSTLLEALHTERDSVGELESMVAILQQNNSAVAEQVKSRDVIIEELNDRIAVFEEDKVVLKAALKQLQKEMSEEAPKTAKLLEDLANAKKEVEHLSVEIESLVETHQKEIAALQQAISQKQETIQATESNLTVIATYVDKLEERLADFTVARRDIEIREERCLQIERNASKAERQKNSLKKRVEELEAEHEELKKLLEELVQERTTLLKERDRLIAQRSAIEQDEQSLREAQARLSEEAEGLIKDRDQLKAQVDQMKKELNEASATNVQLMEQLDQSKTESFRLKDEVEGLSVARKELQGTLQQTESARNKLRAQVARLEADLAEKEKECVKLTTEKALNIETKNATEPEVSMKKTTASEPLLPPKDDSIIANASMAKAPLGPLQRVETPSISEQKVSFAGAQRPAAPVIRPPPPGLPPVQREAKTTAQKLPTTSEGSGPLVLIKKPLPRRVPLRKIRKFFAKATGIHGFFSKKGKEPEPFVTYKGQKPSASTKGPLFPRNSASELRAAKQPPMSKRPT